MTRINWRRHHSTDNAREAVALARSARAGYDRFWIGDSHMICVSHVLAGVAMLTNRIAIDRRHPSGRASYHRHRYAMATAMN
jgi:alkanesulfonate monooxygenase SsuD/methylene tetrahydromethanopterin reductase-like flavin-dependent oxidoreductase (luciferase family)